MSNKPQPWERQRDEDGELEPMLWFERFTLFREMGADRSLLAAANEHKRQKSQEKSNYTPGSWRKASEDWRWRERAEKWDEYELERQSTAFQERADAWRTGRFDDAESLRDKARQLLKLPIVRRSGVDDDGVHYTVEAVPPTTLRAAAAILKTADELARITTRETLPTTEIDHTTGGEPIKSNVIIVREYVDEPESD